MSCGQPPLSSVHNVCCNNNEITIVTTWMRDMAFALTIFRKGALQPINLSVKTRQGRKVVTIITGVEAFGVNATEFAEELRRVCAGSASSEFRANVPAWHI